MIVEDGDIFYMIHGDVTYTDEALYENKLSIVFEDVAAARETLEAVREFIASELLATLSTLRPPSCVRPVTNRFILHHLQEYIHFAPKASLYNRSLHIALFPLRRHHQKCDRMRYML